MIDWIIKFWPWLFTVADIFAAVAATIHAVLRKRDSRAVIAWVGLIWLAPLLGATAYFLFGVNRIRRKAIALNLGNSWVHRRQVQASARDIEHAEKIAKDYPALRGLLRLGLALTEKPLLPGNSVKPLVNGDEAYPVMLKAIDKAEKSVALLSYIFDNDRAGEAFKEALVRAQARGVEVRVLIDHVGSRYSRPTMVNELGKAGLPVAAFLPSRAPKMLKYANLRNHRKILVVDGRVGFTGGTNIREGHWLSTDPAYPVQCLHFRLKGPVVAHLQEAFAVDWAFATGESLHGATWFPTIEPEGAIWARGIPDGPDENFEVLLDTMVGALSVATERVWIVTPYFLPESPLVHALNVAAMRGVEVNIVVPAQNNLPLVQWASTAQFGQLLEKRCRIYLSAPPFDHTKLMIVDGSWSLIGSTNWDPRSLRLNFEYNVECYDDVLAKGLENTVRSKVAGAREVSLEELTALPLPLRLRNGLARLLTPYL